MNVDLKGTFDTTNALSGMYLWLLFGYLVALLNCDLQRYMNSHPLVIHLVGLVAFFFLFAILDSNNSVAIGWVWLKTFFIYFLFVLMTKSKWYFVVPVLMLLLADQSLKKHVAFKKAEGKDDVTELEERSKIASRVINYVILCTIFVGAAQYMYLQKKEYKQDFSIYKFFFGITKCKSEMPRYSRM